jgi:glycosyltransferase involved in cell wall biosynthesis
MPPITAVLHTRNDAQRLGRALETLFPCAEILIVDHHSTDATRRVARQYGARIISAENHAPATHYLAFARHDRLFCIAPTESITEGLQATLFEWSILLPENVEDRTFSISVREQTGETWRQLPAPETRLIPRSWSRWNGTLPASDPAAVRLDGELLRFALP